jgi:hypothetical protein
LEILCIYRGVDEKPSKRAVILELIDKELPPLSIPPRRGDLCPKCRQERLDYDGTLTLVCPKCGVVEGGCFT